ASLIKSRHLQMARLACRFSTRSAGERLCTSGREGQRSPSGRLQTLSTGEPHKSLLIYTSFLSLKPRSIQLKLLFAASVPPVEHQRRSSRARHREGRDHHQRSQTSIRFNTTTGLAPLLKARGEASVLPRLIICSNHSYPSLARRRTKLPFPSSLEEGARGWWLSASWQIVKRDGTLASTSGDNRRSSG